MPSVEQSPARADPEGHAPPPRRMSVRSVAVTGLFVLAGFYTLYFARGFFLPVTLAMLLSFLFSPVVRGLRRWHVPQVVAAALMPVALLAVLTFGAILLNEPAQEWLTQAPDALQRLEGNVRHILQPAARLLGHVQEMTDGAPDGTPTVKMKPASWTETVLNWVKGFVGDAVLTLVLLYFLLAAGDSLVLRLAKMLPRQDEGRRAVEIARTTERTVSTYLFTVSLINLCLGAAVGFAMFLVGIPNPLFWGVMAALLNFVPYFGPLTGCLALVLAALMHTQSWGPVLLPAAIYLGLHGVEANLITPAILGRRLTLNPAMIFVSLAFWSWLWGMAGALMAVPLLMIFKIVCDHVPPLSPVGEFLQG